MCKWAIEVEGDSNLEMEWLYDLLTRCSESLVNQKGKRMENNYTSPSDCHNIK